MIDLSAEPCFTSRTNIGSRNEHWFHRTVPPGSVESISAFISRQHRKHPDRELAKVHDVNRAVVVVIEVGEVAGLTGVQAIARRKQRSEERRVGKEVRSRW